MAEIVQLHIEKTVPELEQMERVGLFTRNEIRKIIKKRKDLEYKLRGRQKTRADFLKYIQYEISVLSLVRKRRQRIGYDFKKQEIDHCIAVRINKLFKAATARHQNDVKLWLSQIEFCKRMNWHHTISGLFARMLQFHNKTPALWVMAAKWEMEENNAPENARNLLQRALRFHPESRLLWQEYFRMELMFADLILKRREILGVKQSKEAEAENDAILDGSVAFVVYRNATKDIDDVDFALSFIPICENFKFANSMIDDIIKDIKKRHPEKEQTLDILARHPLMKLSEEIQLGKERGQKKKEIIRQLEEQVCSLYEEALEKTSTEQMWSYYLNFDLSRLSAAKSNRKKNKVLSHVFNLMKRASEQNCISRELYVEWAGLLHSNGEDDLAQSVALAAARKWPDKFKLWLLCLSLLIQSRKDCKLISETFNEAISSLPEKDTLPIWQFGMEWILLNNPSQLNDLLEHAVQYPLDVSVPLKEAYLEITALREGVNAARELYKRLKKMYPLSPLLFQKMIVIENAQLTPSIKKLRRYHEDALREFGNSNVDLWMSYIRLEIEHPKAKPEAAGELYWRAIKTLNLELTDRFITEHTLFASGHDLTSDKPLPHKMHSIF